MDKYNKSLDRIKKYVEPADNWSKEDYDHYTTIMESLQRQIPEKVKQDYPISAKAFDGKDKVVTFKCFPCPSCGKYIVENTNKKFCEWCGQRIEW